MAQIFRAPELVPANLNMIKLFLAGSIDMGKAFDWQPEMEKALEGMDVAIFNPRRLDFDPQAEYSEDNPYMVEQIEWELTQIKKSEVVVFYFDPKGKAPITLYEHGLVSESVKNGFVKGIVLCPEGYWKRANVIVNSRFHNFTIVDNFRDFQIKTEEAIFEQIRRQKYQL